jgi:hypothetical protein
MMSQATAKTQPSPMPRAASVRPPERGSRRAAADEIEALLGPPPAPTPPAPEQRPAAPAPARSRQAVWSFWLGVASVFFYWAIVTGPIAVGLGIRASRRQRAIDPGAGPDGVEAADDVLDDGHVLPGVGDEAGRGSPRGSRGVMSAR